VAFALSFAGPPVTLCGVAPHAVSLKTDDAAVAAPLPALNVKVYEHLAGQFKHGRAMFQHFGVSTFGAGNAQGVGGANDCWHGAGVKPDASSPTTACLYAKLFNPTHYNATQTMEVAKAFGAQEVCITAHHGGGASRSGRPSTAPTASQRLPYAYGKR